MARFSKFHVIKSLALPLVLGPLFIAPEAAFAGAADIPTTQVVPAPAGAGAARHSENLGQITVNGRKLTPICILDTIKFALDRAHSTSPADADLVVCRFVKVTGSHLANHLWCATNAQITAQYENARTAPRPGIGSMLRSSHGVASASLLAANLPEVNSSKIKALMAKLPHEPLAKCL